MSPISSRKIVPPCGELEAPLAVADGAGEGAAHVAEQLGLEQLLGDRAAVHRHEQAAPRAGCCSGARARQLLAGAALAGDRAPCCRCPRPCSTISSTQRSARARADDVLEAVARAELALEQAVLGLAAGRARSPGRPGAAPRRGCAWSKGFSRYQKAPGAQRLDRGLGAAVAGDHDAGQVGLELVDLPHQLEAVDARACARRRAPGRAARRRRRAMRLARVARARDRVARRARGCARARVGTAPRRRSRGRASLADARASAGGEGGRRV